MSTQRFSDRAYDYARYRPGYPPEAIDAVLADLGDPARLVVADIGAGTGISARLFADRGARVIAVEPNAAMRAAAAPHPRVVWREATAQATGLPDAGVDVAIACQAFHWFATVPAMREFARIARRRVALLQYERDERHPFTRAYGEVVRAYAQDDTEAMRRRALAVFAGFPDARVTRAAFASSQTLDFQGLLGRAASSSYLPKDGAQAVALRRDLQAIFDRYERAGSVDLATIATVLVAELAAAV